jgi:integrase
VASSRKRRGRFEVRWRDGRGQRSRTFTRRADADRFKVEVERQAQLGSLYEAEPTFFADFLDGWLERFEQRVRPSTYARGVQALRTVRELGRSRIHEIRAAEVEDQIAVVGRRAPRQASIALQLLEQVFRSAEQRGHRVDAAIFVVRPPRHEEREPRFLLWSEVERLASSALKVASSSLRRSRVSAKARCSGSVVPISTSRTASLEWNAPLVPAPSQKRSQAESASCI